jgi:hypothetical protein
MPNRDPGTLAALAAAADAAPADGAGWASLARELVSVWQADGADAAHVIVREALPGLGGAAAEATTEVAAHAVRLNPQSAAAWDHLGVALDWAHDQELGERARDIAVEVAQVTLPDHPLLAQTWCNARAVHLDAKMAQGWDHLGVALGWAHDQELGERARDIAVEVAQVTLPDHPLLAQTWCNARAVHLDAKRARGWDNLGVALDRAHDQELGERARDIAVEVAQVTLPDHPLLAQTWCNARAVHLDAKMARGWDNLGVALDRAHDQELGERARDIAVEVAQVTLPDHPLLAQTWCTARAVHLDAKRARGWDNLGVALDRAHDQELGERARDIAVEVAQVTLPDHPLLAQTWCNARAVHLDAKMARGWDNLGVALDRAHDQELGERARDIAVEVAQVTLPDHPLLAQTWCTARAVHLDAKMARGWDSLGFALGRAHDQELGERARDIAVEVAQVTLPDHPLLAQTWCHARAVHLDAKMASGWRNLGAVVANQLRGGAPGGGVQVADLLGVAGSLLPDLGSEPVAAVMRCFGRAVALEPQSAVYWGLLGYVLHREGLSAYWGKDTLVDVIAEAGGPRLPGGGNVAWVAACARAFALGSRDPRHSRPLVVEAIGARCVLGERADDAIAEAAAWGLGLDKVVGLDVLRAYVRLLPLSQGATDAGAWVWLVEDLGWLASHAAEVMQAARLVLGRTGQPFALAAPVRGADGRIVERALTDGELDPLTLTVWGLAGALIHDGAPDTWGRLADLLRAARAPKGSRLTVYDAPGAGELERWRKALTPSGFLLAVGDLERYALRAVGARVRSARTGAGFGDLDLGDNDAEVVQEATDSGTAVGAVVQWALAARGLVGAKQGPETDAAVAHAEGWLGQSLTRFPHSPRRWGGLRSADPSQVARAMVVASLLSDGLRCVADWPNGSRAGAAAMVRDWALSSGVAVLPFREAIGDSIDRGMDTGLQDARVEVAAGLRALDEVRAALAAMERLDWRRPESLADFDAVVEQTLGVLDADTDSREVRASRAGLARALRDVAVRMAAPLAERDGGELPEAVRALTKLPKEFRDLLRAAYAVREQAEVLGGDHRTSAYFLGLALEGLLYQRLVSKMAKGVDRAVARGGAECAAWVSEHSRDGEARAVETMRLAHRHRGVMLGSCAWALRHINRVSESDGFEGIEAQMRRALVRSRSAVPRARWQACFGERDLAKDLYSIVEIRNTASHYKAERGARGTTPRARPVTAEDFERMVRVALDGPDSVFARLLC